MQSVQYIQHVMRMNNVGDVMPMNIAIAHVSTANVNLTDFCLVVNCSDYSIWNGTQ